MRKPLIMKYFKLPYGLSSDHPDPTSAFATMGLSPPRSHGFGGALSSASDDDIEIGEDHATYTRKRTFTRASRSRYTGLIRLIIVFTFGCLATIVTLPRLHSTWYDATESRTEPFDRLFSTKTSGLQDAGSFNSRFENFMQNVLPIECHSHNDYWRTTPLFAALASGCTSVEADVWALDEHLYVGHDTASLRPESTLLSMYLNPLEKILQTANAKSKVGNVATSGHNGVFGMRPAQSLVLLIDFKTDGVATYDRVNSELRSLRQAGWLTHWNGTHRIERPVTVVASGNVPFDRITANDTYRDIFCDAPLSRLVDPEDTLSSQMLDTPLSPPARSVEESGKVNPDILGFKYNPSNSYYASMDLKSVIGLLSQYSITAAHVETLKRQIGEARQRGLVPRYWGTPRWPRNFRDYTWEILIESDVGILNVDDLRAARKGHWGRWTH